VVTLGGAFCLAVPTARAYYPHRSDISILLRAFGRKSYIVVFYMRFAGDFSPQPPKKLWPLLPKSNGEEAFAALPMIWRDKDDHSRLAVP
jgi:hypothetical protein